MAVVWIPPLWQRLTGGQRQVEVEGSTVRQVVDNLEAAFPGLKERICAEDGHLRPEIAVAVDSEVRPEEMQAKVNAQSEVHFLLALSGG